MALRFTTVGAIALLLAACGETDTPDASSYAAGESDAAEVNAAETADAAQADQAAAEVDEDGLTRLDRLAREACAAGDEGFAADLPENAGFAARGPDARVHAAWALDGVREEAIIHTPSLDEDSRLTLDMAVADFLRLNMQAGVDRAGKTGAFRARDGRFCIVQANREATVALRDAMTEAQAILDASQAEASEG
ncbi:MAG: hypothetical protein ACFE0P_09650 [Oceanicaulis sp.]